MSWHEYDRWNTALAHRFFHAGAADVPAYVDVDDDLLEEIRAELTIDAEAGDLADVVRSTLGLEGEGVLRQHVRCFDEWQRRFSLANARRGKGATVDLPPPPVVALLTTFVLAAQQMGADSNLAANAYYPRLGAVLGLSDGDLARLRSKFSETEKFWRGLNDYLAAHEGRLGLPTAFALSYRYVGIPQSQALVRSADRARLPDFFSKFGLSPGSEMIPTDLERLLDGWILDSQGSVSANLQRLWRGGKARDRIAGVVAVELSLWDGALDDELQPAGPRQSGEVRLTAVVRQQFGSRSLELSFVSALRGHAQEVALLVVTSAEGSPSVSVIPAPGNRVRPIPGSMFDGESLLGAVVTVADPVSGKEARRTPRRVVPLRRDDLLGVLVEAEKVQLAEDSVLLVKDEEPLLGSVLSVLGTYGRHGEVFRAVGASSDVVLPGLPQGWALVDDVQLYRVPQDVKRLDLHALIPLSTAQLQLARGLKLPGRIRKWSTLCPPEVRVAVAEADALDLALTEQSSGRLLHRWSENSDALVVPLDSLGLLDGDYELELSAGKEVISRSGLRLRSADSPDVAQWETCTRLNYELEQHALGALTAVPAQDATALVVDGLYAHGRWPTAVAEAPVVVGATWSTAKSASGVDRPAVVLGVTDSESCVVTGKHRLHYPTWHGGRSSKRTIDGVCVQCGLRKTHPVRPPWKGTSTTPVTPAPVHAFAASAGRGRLDVGWDVCLDALVHAGGGTAGDLERVASQAEGTSLFADRFTRTLEMLGHIDVRRGPNMLPAEWEANPACLAETTTNGFALTGVWSESSRAQLGTLLAAAGGRLVAHRAGDDELTTWYARGVGADVLEVVVADLDLGVEVVPRAAETILDALPPLSAVEAAIPAVPMPAYDTASIFALDASSWRTVPGVGVPGAYRVEQSFRRLTIWVDAAGAVDRTARVGSIQLVKHLAARAAGRPILGWVQSGSTLVVPLGADLPGLYGRAAAACSGREPVVSTRTRTLGYPDVPRHVADRLNALLLG